MKRHFCILFILTLLIGTGWGFSVQADDYIDDVYVYGGTTPVANVSIINDDTYSEYDYQYDYDGEYIDEENLPTTENVELIFIEDTIEQTDTVVKAIIRRY